MTRSWNPMLYPGSDISRSSWSWRTYSSIHLYTDWKEKIQHILKHVYTWCMGTFLFKKNSMKCLETLHANSETAFETACRLHPRPGYNLGLRQQLYPCPTEPPFVVVQRYLNASSDLTSHLLNTTQFVNSALIMFHTILSKMKVCGILQDKNGHQSQNDITSSI